MTDPAILTDPAFDKDALADKVVRAFLAQALNHGVFHADLHGKIAHLLRPDTRGTRGVEPHYEAASFGHELDRAHEAAVALAIGHAPDLECRRHDEFGAGRIFVERGDTRLGRGKAREEVRTARIFGHEADLFQNRGHDLSVQGRTDKRCKCSDCHQAINK